MAFCRGRLYFDAEVERRSDDIGGVVQTLNFQDSDLEEDFHEQEEDGEILDSSGITVPFTSFCGTPPRDGIASALWDSGIATPTPSSPKMVRRSPKSSCASPIPFSALDESDEDSPHSPMPPVPPTPYTPPHKRFRSLRLYDTPHTPKSLLQRAQRRVSRARPRADSFGSKESLKFGKMGPQANVNPFSHEDKLPCSVGVKRTRSALDRSVDDESLEELEDDMPCSKKLALHEINTSRYNEEFYEVAKLGDGEFGSVYKCINRLDGCTYAIKKSKTPVAGSANERSALNEVYAHAVLGKHQHVVRYYSAWAENDHMYIQNEFCNGGSLAETILENLQLQQKMSEAQLKQLLLHLAQGVKYIHSQGLVHLDIKPGNIFITQNTRQGPESGLEEDLMEEEEPEDDQDSVVYKIGDLGHVTSATSPLVEEGDCRYLPNEILQEDFHHLSKADVFSLALTVYEAGGGDNLPKNGDAWHRIRNGNLPHLEQCSKDFNNLLACMIHKDPKKRPSANTLVQNPVLCPYAKKSRAQLRKELNEEKFKNELLSRQLEEAILQASPLVERTKPITQCCVAKRSARLLGGKSKVKVNRSLSVNIF